MLAVLAAVAGFRRLNEVLSLLLRHVEFCDSHATITLETRKNVIHRESRVRISLQPATLCCLATLLKWWRDIGFGS
jgi:hypothetical protein